MGASVAAVLIAKERHIVDAYQRAGATSPDTAVTPASLGVGERLAFRKLVGHAVLRETTPGTYYVDDPSWRALRSLRRRLATIFLLAAILIALVGWLGIK